MTDTRDAFQGLDAVIERLGAERDDLEEELYRRVGSNLSLMRGVVDATAGIPEGIRLRLADRVSVLAVVHGLIGAYAIGPERRFTELCKGLAAYFGVKRPDGGHRVRVTASSDASPLLFSDLKALGLIIGELLQNAYDHAFAPGEEGAVLISLRGTPDGGYRLSFKDSGRGLPEGVSVAKGGAGGLFLVRACAGELGAELFLDPGPGTAWRLEVPLRLRPPRS